MGPSKRRQLRPSMDGWMDGKGRAKVKHVASAAIFDQTPLPIQTMQAAATHTTDA